MNHIKSYRTAASPPEGLTGSSRSPAVDLMTLSSFIGADWTRDSEVA